MRYSVEVNSSMQYRVFGHSCVCCGVALWCGGASVLCFRDWLVCGETSVAGLD